MTVRTDPWVAAGDGRKERRAKRTGLLHKRHRCRCIVCRNCSRAPAASKRKRLCSDTREPLSAWEALGPRRRSGTGNNPSRPRTPRREQMAFTCSHQINQVLRALYGSSGAVRPLDPPGLLGPAGPCGICSPFTSSLPQLAPRMPPACAMPWTRALDQAFRFLSAVPTFTRACLAWSNPHCGVSSRGSAQSGRSGK